MGPMSLLSLRDVRKTYRTPDGGQQTVLDVAEFSMEPHTELAIAGSSGSGKTTFLNIIAGLLRPDQGEVVLAGHSLTQLSEARRDRVRADHLGYVFQTFHLLGAYSALENVTLGMAFGPGPDTGLATELLCRLGLSDRLYHRPHQLSVGQQQRVALARALANRPIVMRPALLLADEPTGNLDPTSSQEALGLIRELCKENGASLLLVSHDPAVLAVFDRTLDFAELNRAHPDAHPRAAADLGAGERA